MAGTAGCKGDKAPSSSARPGSEPTTHVERAKQAEPPGAAPTAAPASKPDLDMLCPKAKELSASPPKDQRALWRNVLKQIQDPQIKKGFDAIMGQDADIEYQLAVQVAKQAGVADWRCPDLKAFLQTRQ